MSSLDLSVSKPLIPFLRPITDALTPVAVPMVRVVTGLFLMPHGAQKLFGWFGGYGIEATSQFFATKLGLPPFLAVLAGLIEFFGGLALAVGFATRAAAALVVGLMTVAVIQVHLAAGFFATQGGFEYPLFWAIAALSFVIQGGGRYSLDGLIGHEI